MASKRLTTITTRLTNASAAIIHEETNTETAIAFNDGGNGMLKLDASASGVSLPMIGVTSASFMSIRSLDNALEFKVDSGSQLTLKALGKFASSFGAKKPQAVTLYNPSTTDAVNIEYVVNGE